MSQIQKTWVLLLLCLFFSHNGYPGGGYISNAMSVAAFGSDGGYLITNINELLKWNQTTYQWELVAKLTPHMYQIDCLTDGKDLVGTDNASKAWKWNEESGFLSAWSQPRSSKQYYWVKHDPVTDVTKGWLPGFTDLRTTESWDEPALQAGDDWYKYLPIKQATATDSKKPRILVDKDESGAHRWHEKDIPYFINRNKNTPFYIYYYGTDENAALNRFVEPRSITDSHANIPIKQISYDEDEANLWGIGMDGKPYHWDMANQEWELRDHRGEELTESQKALQDLLRQEDDYYVRTTYIKGYYNPTLIVLKDSLIMNLILGTLGSRGADELTIILFENAKQKTHNADHVLWQPRYRPQKIVHPESDRIDKRIRENHYLERTLRSLNIIANDNELGAYPSTHRRIRR